MTCANPNTFLGLLYGDWEGETVCLRLVASRRFGQRCALLTGQVLIGGVFQPLPPTPAYLDANGQFNVTLPQGTECADLCTTICDQVIAGFFCKPPSCNDLVQGSPIQCDTDVFTVCTMGPNDECIHELKQLLPDGPPDVNTDRFLVCEAATQQIVAKRVIISPTAFNEGDFVLACADDQLFFGALPPHDLTILPVSGTASQQCDTALLVCRVDGITRARIGDPQAIAPTDRFLICHNERLSFAPVLPLAEFSCDATWLAYDSSKLIYDAFDVRADGFHCSADPALADQLIALPFLFETPYLSTSPLRRANVLLPNDYVVVCVGGTLRLQHVPGFDVLPRNISVVNKSSQQSIPYDSTATITHRVTFDTVVYPQPPFGPFGPWIPTDQYVAPENGVYEVLLTMQYNAVTEFDKLQSLYATSDFLDFWQHSINMRMRVMVNNVDTGAGLQFRDRILVNIFPNFDEDEGHSEPSPLPLTLTWSGLLNTNDTIHFEVSNWPSHDADVASTIILAQNFQSRLVIKQIA